MLKKTTIILLVVVVGLVVLHRLSDMETTPLNAAERKKLDLDFVKLKHGHTHYRLHGNKHDPLIVLVHGFSVPNYLWDRNIDALLAQGFQVLRFDLYGRGFSARPEVDYTLDLFVDQIQELTAALGIHKTFHLVGISMGGAVSTRYAVKHADQIKSLSLLAPLVETPERADLKLLAIPGLGEYLATVVMMPKIRNNLANTVYDVATYPEWSEKMNQHIHYEGYRRALLSTVRYLSGKSFVDDYRELGQTTIPTQLIWGEQDPVVPIEGSALIRNVAGDIPLHRLDKTGHLPQIEQTENVNALLTAFLVTNQ